MLRVTVPVADRAYPVHVGRDAIAEFPTMVPEHARRVAVVTQPSIPAAYTDLAPLLDGRTVETFTIGESEQAKSLATIEWLSRSFAEFGLTRRDLVVGVGGGLVTDVAGFAAASWHRGTDVVHVPTTLLGMVDAAIGGKTAVNIPEGKNLVGAFWQPSGVICDLDRPSDTLPAP